MPLGSKNTKEVNKNTVDYKARLERKLCLARETPEPIFDLADCNLKNVPNNIFSLCKVFRKDALYLQNNLLTSLENGGSLVDLKNIKVFDISANKFTKLPQNIDVIEKLEVLDVSNNQLKELPETIGLLVNLIWLNLSYNNLSQLPLSLGNCKNLEVLNVTFNEKLKKLPNTLGNCQSLVQLDVDPTIIYPPQEICKKGIDAILNFFVKELHGDVSVPSTSFRSKKPTTEPSYDSLEEQIRLQEKLKLEKQQQRLDLEKLLLNENQKEVEMHQQSKDKRLKLLEDLKQQEKTFNAELEKLQEKKNYDRATLLKLCQEEELKSNEIVNKILNSNTKNRVHFSDVWDKERADEENKLLNKSAESRAVQRKQILLSMNELMAEEIRRAQNISSGKRVFAVQSLASEITEQSGVIQNFISKSDQSHSELIESLRRNEEFQKSAVASLLEKSDSASWELARQVSIVEAQLAELTRLEFAKKKLETESQIVELNKNRVALTNLLMDLFDQQAERRKQLIDTIRKMETLKTSDKEPDTFWMEQYEKLLHSKSYEMVQFLEAVDPALAYQMFLNGVFHYLPLLKDVALSREELKSLDLNTLIKVGIKNAEDRSAVLKAVESYLLSEESRDSPSAPLSEEPSAPLLNYSDSSELTSFTHLVPEECVICLDNKPNVIFLPCGHICCCYKCFMSIALCPLCRKPIDEIHEVVHRQ